MKRLIGLIIFFAVFAGLLLQKPTLSNAQSASCGNLCAQSGCYGTCTRIGQYCLQPPAACPPVGGSVVENVFQCLGSPPTWLSSGSQVVTTSCCGTCGLPSPTPINGGVCATGAVQVLFIADRLPNPAETVTCDISQNDLTCAPCQGLLKSDTCSITSSSPNQDCSLATIDASCRDFLYTCKLNGVQFTSGVVPNPVNNSTSYISLTLPNASTLPTTCSCNPPPDPQDNNWTDNFCFHPSNTTGCDMTTAGGYCDPNGDASYQDADWVRGYYDYLNVCGGTPQRPPPTATPTSQNCYNLCIASGKTPAVCSATCRPTNTPTPTFTPTPTKFQPQVVITVNPTFSPIGNNQNPPATMDAQRWACVNSAPCSELLSLCQGTSGDDTKRAKLNGDNLLPGRATYIFECLINTDPANGPQVGPQCTTGNATVDNQLLGTSLLNQLQSPSGYNYTLIGIYDDLGNPIAPGSPIYADNQGRIGPIEWESKTPGFRIGRMFVAMNSIDPLGFQGNDPGQKQGLFDLTDLPTSSCLMLTWDPEGVVFDTATKKPIEHATITILKKLEDGSFSNVTGHDVLGGIVNPFVTGPDGRYMFRVPDGIYRLKIEADGYHFPSKIDSSANFAPYTDIYTGDDIVEKGGPTHADIPMDPVKKNIFNLVIQTIQDIF